MLSDRQKQALAFLRYHGPKRSSECTREGLHPSSLRSLVHKKLVLRESVEQHTGEVQVVYEITNAGRDAYDDACAYELKTQQGKAVP